VTTDSGTPENRRSIPGGIVTAVSFVYGVHSFRCFRPDFSSVLNIEAANFCEAFVNICQTARSQLTLYKLDSDRVVK
jgi:hypothetical protein